MAEWFYLQPLYCCHRYRHDGERTAINCLCFYSSSLSELSEVQGERKQQWGGVHGMNAYSLVLRTHPLPSFNINELGFSQSSCFLLVLKGVISRALSTGVEHMQAMLGFFKNHLVEAKGERMRFFFL